MIQEYWASTVNLLKKFLSIGKSNSISVTYLDFEYRSSVFFFTIITQARKRKCTVLGLRPGYSYVIFCAG